MPIAVKNPAPKKKTLAPKKRKAKKRKARRLRVPSPKRRALLRAAYASEEQRIARNLFVQQAAREFCGPFADSEDGSERSAKLRTNAVTTGVERAEALADVLQERGHFTVPDYREGLYR